MGFPAPSKTRFALTEPAQIEVPTFQTGMSFQPIDVARGAIVDPVMPHASYSHAIGKLNNEMPVQFENHALVKLSDSRWTRDVFSPLRT